MSVLHWYACLGLAASIAMFSSVFRKVRAELRAARDRGIPVAIAVAAGRPRAVGPSAAGRRSRWMALAPTLQASLVAAAATSIFVMALCLMLCVALVVRGG